MNLEDLEKKLEDINSNKKRVREEIKKATEQLQNELKAHERDYKQVANQIKEVKRAKMLDKNIHILDRFNLWMNSKDKINEDWIIEEGPLRDTLFDDEYKHSTINIPDRMYDYFYEITYYHSYSDSDENLDLNDIEASKITFNNYDKDMQEEIIEVLENAINLNVEEFTYDW